MIERLIHHYGEAPSQAGELFLPVRRSPFGVVVVVHGGYWQLPYDRSLMTALCEDLVRHGLAAWNLEYRRIGEGGGWPETLEDVACGIDALANLDSRLDLERVGAVGHSAGGHLALWACARPTLPPGAPGAAPVVTPRAVVSQAGIIDLRLAAVTVPSDKPTNALLGGSPDEHPERYELASPRDRLPLGIDQLILHGDRDETASIRLAESYVAAARRAGDPCELRVLPDTGHMEHLDPSTPAWATAREWLGERL
ncbi:MAG: alpha/beta fold hydrolase [Actinobacteria bacterium]|nr:alpha/beta fold hydrolase [Actinomycetota bacterium]